MNEINSKWKDIFPEFKEEQDIVEFFERYIDKELLEDEKRVMHRTYNINKEIFFRLEKIIDKDCPFNKFIILMLARFYEKLEYEIQKYHNIAHVEQIIDDVLRYLGEKILTIVVRTLVKEIHQCEEANKLVGNTEEKRYEYYNEQLSINQDYIYELEEKYPVLFKMVDELICNQIEYVKELFEGIVTYNKDIASLLGTEKIGKVRGVRFGLGDSHCGGKTVVQVMFQEGEVIYKPRNLSVEKQWFNLANYINEKCGKSVLKAAKTISGVNCGFMEKIPNKQCENKKEVKEFFYHSGCLLAILYSLNASDCHYENVISFGTYPVVIDAELLLGINPNENKDDKGSIIKAIKSLYYSVAQVGLLPFQISVGKKKVNIGGVQQVDKQTAPIKSLVIKDKGSVKIHFEYEECTIKKKENVPTLSKSLEEKECIKCITDGFEELYDFVLEYKEEYIRTVLSLFEKVNIRVLYNPTMIYGNLLGISYDPMFMESQSNRMKLLSRIALLNKENEALVHSELDMMMSNDIPYYSIKFNEHTIIDGYGNEVTDKHIFTPCDIFLRKMSWIGKRDRGLQKEILQDSYYSFDYHDNLTDFKWVNKVELDQECVIQKDMLDTAEDILDYLCETRSFTDINNAGIKERCFVGSTILNMDKDNWRKDLIDFDLYDGHIGLAYLYLYASKYMNHDKYREIAQEIFNMIQSNFHMLLKNNTILTGLHKGLGGYILTFTKYYEYGQKESLKFLNAFMKLGLDAMEKNNNNDLVGGNIGFVLATLYTIDRVQDMEVKQLADSIINKFRDMVLYEKDKIYVNFSGYAHGISSLVVVLYRIYKYLKDPDMLKLTEKLIKYDRETFFDIEKHDWYRSKDEKEFSRGWCHGCPGVLLGRVHLKKMGYVDKYIEDEIKWLTEHTIKESFGYNLSFCHGDLGNLSILKEVAAVNNNQQLSKLVKANFQELYKKSIKDWNQLKKPVEKLDGLMVGLGGIAFALINFAQDDEVPPFISLI